MAEFPAWGIHITASSVRGVKLNDEDGEIHVVAHDQVDFLEDVEDLGSLERFAALGHALAVFTKRHDLGRSRVVVSVDATAAFNRFVQAPTMQNESLVRILEYEGQQQIPFNLDEVFWDHKVLAVREEDDLVEVMLFAVKKTVVDERLRRLGKMKFPVDAIQLAPVALYNYAVQEGLAKDGYALVGVDLDRVDVVLCHGTHFWFRSIPDGIHPMFGRVRDEFGVRYREAVRMLRGEEDCPDPGLLQAIRREVADGLVNEIARLLQYYASARDHAHLKGIILVPGSPLVPSMAGPLKEAAGTDVYGAKEFRRIGIAPDIVTPEIDESIGTLAHATGLALQGIEKADVDVKLFPPEVTRVFAGRQIFHVLSVLVLFVLVAGMWWFAAGFDNEVARARQELEDLVGQAEAGSQEFRKRASESQVEDDFAPLLNAGNNRLTPVRAVTAVLAGLTRANRSRNSGTTLYLARVATRVQEDENAGVGHRRTLQKVEAVVAQELQGGSQSAIRRGIEGDFCRHLADQATISNVKVEEVFVAATLSTLAVADIENKKLRRRFVHCRIAFNFDGHSGDGEGK